MRLFQLNFHIDNFPRGEEKYVIQGYIDANNPYEVLNQLLVECGKIYEPDLSPEVFCKKVAEYSKGRFGATEVQKKDMEMSVIDIEKLAEAINSEHKRKI